MSIWHTYITIHSHDIRKIAFMLARRLKQVSLSVCECVCQPTCVLHAKHAASRKMRAYKRFKDNTYVSNQPVCKHIYIQHSLTHAVTHISTRVAHTRMTYYSSSEDIICLITHRKIHTQKRHHTNDQERVVEPRQRNMTHLRSGSTKQECSLCTPPRIIYLEALVARTRGCNNASTRTRGCNNASTRTRGCNNVSRRAGRNLSSHAAENCWLSSPRSRIHFKLQNGHHKMVPDTQAPLRPHPEHSPKRCTNRDVLCLNQDGNAISPKLYTSKPWPAHHAGKRALLFAQAVGHRPWEDTVRPAAHATSCTRHARPQAAPSLDNSRHQTSSARIKAENARAGCSLTRPCAGILVEREVPTPALLVKHDEAPSAAVLIHSCSSHECKQATAPSNRRMQACSSRKEAFERPLARSTHSHQRQQAAAPAAKRLQTLLSSHAATNQTLTRRTRMRECGKAAHHKEQRRLQSPSRPHVDHSQGVATGESGSECDQGVATGESGSECDQGVATGESGSECDQGVSMRNKRRLMSHVFRDNRSQTWRDAHWLWLVTLSSLVCAASCQVPCVTCLCVHVHLSCSCLFTETDGMLVCAHMCKQ
jgi:hypothetical protein